LVRIQLGLSTGGAHSRERMGGKVPAVALTLMGLQMNLQATWVRLRSSPCSPKTLKADLIGAYDSRRFKHLFIDDIVRD
jgi:hypothetical protein